MPFSALLRRLDRNKKPASPKPEAPGVRYGGRMRVMREQSPFINGKPPGATRSKGKP